MSKCSIIQCGARKNPNQPHLTLHRFPKNEVLLQKWLDVIGMKNIKPGLKAPRVCSLHFAESSYNKTLDVIRLRDDAVPSIHLVPSKKPHGPVLREIKNVEEQAFSMMTLPALPVKHLDQIYKEIEPESSTSENAMPSTSGSLPSKKPHGPGLREIKNVEEQAFSMITQPPLPVKDLDQIYKEIEPESSTSENAMPSTSGSLPSKKPHGPGLREIKNVEEQAFSMITQPPLPVKDLDQIYKEIEPESSTSENAMPSTSGSLVHHQPSKSIKLQDICVSQRKKIKRLNEKIRRQVKKISSMQDIITDLKNKVIINTEQSILLEECAGSQDFLKRQISKSKGLPLEKKYSEEIRKFALTLHFLSPKAYDYIRRVYNTCLPHPRTLTKWYQNVNAEPGFTREAFDTLKKKVSQSGSQKILCALSLDEMAIRKGLTWDPKFQKYHGRVDYGHNVDSSDSSEEASQCLVLLLTCINGSWKLPIGYFFVTSVTGEQKCVLIETAIKLTEDTGCIVVSVTCDGLAANFSMYSLLGCEIAKNQEHTTFVSSHNNTIHAFIDPCHAVKLIRNTLGELRVFIDPSDRKIDFGYLEKLLKLQENQGLHLGTKISKAHIFFEKQKMKVKLATQLLSNSVADALIFCKTVLKLKEFEECDGTVNFINMINDVFDVLNSHSIRPPGWKKAMCPQNIGFIRALFASAIDYLRFLKLESGELLIESRRKTGFIGLIVDMKSALKMYEKIVEEKKYLKYIPLYKISQDHLELFFSAIRSRGGFNNNPNAVQFRAAYKRLLVRAEIRDGGIGNCVPLEQVNILTCSSKNPVESLNELTEKKQFIEIEEDHSDLYDCYVELLTQEVDSYSDSVLEYISGFVTRKLSKTIKCDLCLSLLCGPKNEKSLIYFKSRGGLVYASATVISIIKRSENLIKHCLTTKCKPELYYLYIFKFLVEHYDCEKLFCLNADHDTTHRMLLIKSIIKTFADIRFRYFGRKLGEKLSFRNYFNKLTLFRNE